jgi:hypothetical protein
MMQDVRVDCPYCGESFDIVADCTGGNQTYIEDCAVCCRPIEFGLQVTPDGEFLGLSAQRDDD